MGQIEIVVRRLILVVWCVSNVESAQYLDVRQTSFLWVIDAVDPHSLSGQRAWRSAETGDAGKAGPELIDHLRGEDVGLCDRQIPVVEVTDGREPGDGGAGERHIL